MEAAMIAREAQGLAVDAVLVAAAAIGSAVVTGWLAESVVWLLLALSLTYRPR